MAAGQNGYYVCDSERRRDYFWPGSGFRTAGGRTRRAQRRGRRRMALVLARGGTISGIAAGGGSYVAGGGHTLAVGEDRLCAVGQADGRKISERGHCEVSAVEPGGAGRV